MEVMVFVTGGTIDGLDKESRPAEEQYTLVPSLLRSAKLAVDYSVEILMIKDSSLLTDEDRTLIAKNCQECEEEHVVITHGTDTMVQTAQFLDQHKLGKTVVLTGSFVPANKDSSDAMFNLGAAFVSAQTLPPGVYIAMNGCVFNANNARKNFEKNIFEEK